MRRAIRYILWSLAAVVIIAATLLAWFSSRFDAIARDEVQRALERKLQSEVELGSIETKLLPSVHGVIRNLKLRHRGRTDVPPFIEIESAEIRADYLGLLARPVQLDIVKLTGLRIHIPPKESPGSPRLPKFGEPGQRKPPPDFVIGRVMADGTVLTVLPKDPNREPLVWEMKKLQLRSAGPHEPMRFDTVLTNAKPPGEIVSKGRFGPWNSNDLGDTPVAGDYTFENADLGVFDGIAGILSSKGGYTGVLGRIEAFGTTETPDFRLGPKGNRVPLTTEFHAIIDGTDGDTYLEPVKAMLASTPIICRGKVAGQPGTKGKTIDLETRVPQGRIDDLLRLAVPGPRPPLTGAVRLQARLVIPPGDVDVVRKLRLAGTFGMDRVRFTNPEVQQKLVSMSQRAQGQPGEEPDGPVTSSFQGKFRVGSGQVRLDHLRFALPGAEVLLSGDYGMRSEEMDFTGDLRMQARISQTVKGVKSWLLKPVDPFFAKDGMGAVIPIRISGARDNPHFGLNLRGRKR